MIEWMASFSPVVQGLDWNLIYMGGHGFRRRVGLLLYVD